MYSLQQQAERSFVLNAQELDNIVAMQISPDGSLVFVGDRLGKLAVYTIPPPAAANMTKIEPSVILPLHSESITDIAISRAADYEDEVLQIQTVGRDGVWAKHRLERRGLPEVQVVTLSRVQLSRGWIEKVEFVPC